MVNKVRVMEYRCNGQKLITLPKAICEAYDLKKGDVLNFSYIHKQGKITGLIVKKE